MEANKHVDVKGKSDIIYTISYPCGSLGICVRPDGGDKVFRFGSKNAFAPALPLGDQCVYGTFIKLYHNIITGWCDNDSLGIRTFNGKKKNIQNGH